MTAEVITGRKFGNRTGYVPAETVEEDDSRAKHDADFIRSNPAQLNYCLQGLRMMHEQIPVTIAEIRQKPPHERIAGWITVPLYELYIELCLSCLVLHRNAPYYAKVAIEMEERIEAAQRYIVEHAAH